MDDPSAEKYSDSPPHDLIADQHAGRASQPLSPSLQRAAQAHYVDPYTAPSPFAPPPVGAGDDAPTMRARPAPHWPDLACRYCGWHPVDAGSTCPQCHQPVPVPVMRAIPWRSVAIGALGITTALALILAFVLLQQLQAAGHPLKGSGAATTKATASPGAGTATISVTGTSVPPTVTTGGGTPGAGVAVGATATPAPATPTSVPATPRPTSTPACSWQAKTSTGTYYIYWPGGGGYGPGHYGYVISATIHYDGCGNAYAGADVTSDDDGSPPSTVTAVLYRTANCNGSDKILSQQHSVALVAGAHSVGTLSTTSYGQHCVFAAAIDGNSAGNSQTITSVIVIAD